MESDHHHHHHQNEEVVMVEMGTGSNGSSRWNPTKEQISLLENLYKQGIKTPSAEEIQQITARLRVYGHIEGKNVFYWFQNHKARQRQKEKQEQTIAYYNSFLHRPQPIFPSQIPLNAMCAPYCIPQAQCEMSTFHPQLHQKVLLPAVGFRRSQGEQKVVSNDIMTSIYNSKPVVYEECMQDRNRISEYDCFRYSNQQTTLDLFPLHPTGVKQGRSAVTTKDQVSSSLPSVCIDSSTDTHSVSPDNNEEHHGCPEKLPFFDFFNSPGQGF